MVAMDKNSSGRAPPRKNDCYLIRLQSVSLLLGSFSAEEHFKLDLILLSLGSL